MNKETKTNNGVYFCKVCKKQFNEKQMMGPNKCRKCIKLCSFCKFTDSPHIGVYQCPHCFCHYCPKHFQDVHDYDGGLCCWTRDKCHEDVWDACLRCGCTSY